MVSVKLVCPDFGLGCGRNFQTDQCKIGGSTICTMILNYFFFFKIFSVKCVCQLFYNIFDENFQNVESKICVSTICTRKLMKKTFFNVK